MQLREYLDTNVLGLKLHPGDALRHIPTHVQQKTHRAVIREREGLEAHTLTTSRDRSKLTTTLNPSAVNRPTINFSPFSWVVRPPGQDGRNLVKK
jgi:hypothetical protein